jgi:hypothetical protein
MNYEKIYAALMQRAKTRILPKETYVEKHHIVPRCLEGNNSPENIVKLLPEEHYLAHQLLVRIYPGNNKLIFACIAMTGNPHQKRNNKAYGWIRRKVSEAKKSMPVSEESRRKHSETSKRLRIKPPNRLGQKHTPEAKANMSKAQTGRTISEKHREALSKSKLGTTASDEAKKNMSKASKGKPKTPEHREALRLGVLKGWETRRINAEKRRLNQSA